MLIMKSICIGSAQCVIKDYHCAGKDGVYVSKQDDKLWLYVNITNQCNARCPFCVNADVNVNPAVVDSEILSRVLKRVKSHIRGVSITGGEPMLYPDLVDTVAMTVKDILGETTPLELVTNGTNLHSISSLRSLDRIASIHISRHMVGDDQNRELMGFEAPSFAQIRKLVARLADPGKVVLNCVMQKGGIETEADIRSFLEMASWAGVRNTSFVGLFLANRFCEEHYISPSSLSLKEDNRFSIWNQYHDYDYCSCSSGDYRAENGYVRFYYRCPGVKKAEYVRQLVYTHDNRLLTGFGGEEIRF